MKKGEKGEKVGRGALARKGRTSEIQRNPEESLALSPNFLSLEFEFPKRAGFDGQGKGKGREEGDHPKQGRGKAKEKAGRGWGHSTQHFLKTATEIKMKIHDHGVLQ